MRKTALVLALGLGCALCWAQRGCASEGLSTAWAAYGWQTPSLYVQDYVPYYAMHPPVYYSYVVPRPYGYSPFAYPPGTFTPEPRRAEPLVVPNPFVPATQGRDGPKHRTASAPLRIVNPYLNEPAGPRRPRQASVAMDIGF